MNAIATAAKAMTDTTSSPGLLLHSPLLAEIPGISHGYSTRRGGVSRGSFSALNLSGRVGDVRDAVTENRHCVLHALERPGATFVFVNQVHGDAVVEVTQQAGRAIEADALLTRDPHAAVAVLVADCVPVLVAHESGRMVAAIHAGWRGTVAGICGQAVARFNGNEFAPSALRAALGPAIGPCCFTVGEEVAQQLAAVDADLPAGAVQSADDGQWKADLWQINAAILVRAGVPRHHIDALRICTVCDPAFFSHRRDRGVTGRQAGIIATAPIS